MVDKMDATTEQNAFREDLLNGKTAIVTGASRGIGAAIAQRLCEAGANVVLCSRSAESVAQIADTLRAKATLLMQWPPIFLKRLMLKHLLKNN